MGCVAAALAFGLVLAVTLGAATLSGLLLGASDLAYLMANVVTTVTLVTLLLLALLASVYLPFSLE